MENSAELAAKVVPSTTMETHAGTAKVPILSSTIKYRCERCQDTGWVRTGDLSVWPCECRGRSARDRRKSQGIPPRYSEARLSDQPKPIVDMVRKAIRESNGLFLTGPAGVGKTYLAAGIVIDRIEAGKHAAFLRAADLYCEVRNTFNSSESEHGVLHRYSTTELLVLDDLATGSLSDFERRVTLNLLDIRWNNLLPTVITSNRTIDQISELMDERIASRLRSYFLIALQGRDRRARTR